MDHNKPYSDDYLKDILQSVKTIAMVGASPDKTKFSYGVLRVLHETGYDMIPVNPRPEITEIRNLKVGKITNPINIQNGYLLIKLNDKREYKEQINIEDQLKKLIANEKNRQLNSFSNIFYKRLKKNVEIYDY